MNTSGGPSFLNLSPKEKIGPIFNDKHQDARGCSIRLTNDFGTNYEEIPAGTIISKTHNGLCGPCAYDTCEAVAAASSVTLKQGGGVPSSQFKSGDWAFFAGAVFPVMILAVNGAVLMLAENITIAEDASIDVDPSISVAQVQALGAAGNTLTFNTAAHAKRFKVNDVVNIDGIVGVRNITAVDIPGGTITFDGAAGTVAADAKIVSQSRGGYKVLTQTVFTNYGLGVTPSNIIGEYRTHGEVFSKRLRGLSPSRKLAMDKLEYNTYRV